MADIPGRSAGDRDRVTHRLRVDPTRSMKAVTAEIDALLADLEESSRHSGALLATELIAQVVGRAPGASGEPVGLTIEVREDAIRLEAAGPVAPSVEEIADRNGDPPDPLADWGRYIIDRFADRWGIGGGAQREIWAEIEVPT
jgi:hypothetical protein